MRIRDAIDLRMHRSEHVGVTMTDTRHCGAAGRIQIFLAGAIGDPAALRASRNRIVAAQLAMKDVRFVVHQKPDANYCAPRSCASGAQRTLGALLSATSGLLATFLIGL